MDALEEKVAAALGLSSARRLGTIQTLWNGYGEAVRLALPDGSNAVVKQVVPGRGSGRGHDRKLRSYEVEQAFYTDWATRCGPGCRVAAARHLERSEGGWLFVLEDLASAGFDRPARELEPMIDWLAAFHGRFLGERPRGLWKEGSYWHLRTRPDEHRAMRPGPLKDGAAALDARLASARFRTLVHGDAKPANFLRSRAAVAAVDFQYVGGGTGMRDVAYLLAGESERTRERLLDQYFRSLRGVLASEVEGEAVEAEWRALYPFAWADFHRFLEGWAPSWRVRPDEQALTRQALSSL